jgi:NADPH-dependent curcumin reductase CurA
MYTDYQIENAEDYEEGEFVVTYPDFTGWQIHSQKLVKRVKTRKKLAKTRKNA